MDVVDLGCGSGKLATQLLAVGHRVVGVDPSLELLRVSAAKGIVATCGRAEALPLRDASADVVTAAQAFHWFDHQRAVPEMRRSLRRGGRVGLLWNLRDESVDWVRELSSIIGSEDAMARTLGRIDEMGADVERKLRHDGDFPIVEQEIFDHFQELSEEGLVALIGSRSYIALLGEDERTRS
jgi:ubiquinone/menaquinone biosynthesis C-methylase UbiE